MAINVLGPVLCRYLVVSCARSLQLTTFTVSTSLQHRQLPKHCYERAMVALPAVDPAFRVSGSTPGLELWRIENLKPVRQEAVTGLFFDAYILSYYTEKV